jgi:L-fucose isomerase-like protein
MNDTKTTFALFFGNRGFFPASLMKEARAELPRVLKALGHETILMPESATRYGAVETVDEGALYARFLVENRGRFGGVILCLPNFGDETGAVAALKDAGVPILIHAYPDELDKLGPALRRDSFCGKFSIMDVFTQYGIPFTVFRPHVAHPSDRAFRENVASFDKICRVVNGMKDVVIGMIGARTTPFKTVRCDELTLQRHGVAVETLDLSSIIARTKGVDIGRAPYKDKARQLKSASDWAKVPAEAFENIAKLGVVLDEVVGEYKMNAVAMRCWLELQEQLGISPCIAMGLLTDSGVAAACETDVGSAVAMRLLSLASGQASACLDWNNNYGREADKCIVFHCSAVAPSLIRGLGRIEDHSILATAVGPGRSFGPNTGRLAAMDFTFGNLLTDSGEIHFYMGEGRITEDPIDDSFFGCAGVAQIDRMEEVFLHVGRRGHRHHVNLTRGLHAEALEEAMNRYLGYKVTLPQRGC